MKKILCIDDNPIAHDLYHRGLYPSHFLYGIIEVEKAGFEVVISTSPCSGKDWVNLINNIKPDLVYIIFFSNIHLSLLWMKLIGKINIPLVVISHKTLSYTKKTFYKKYLYDQIDCCFFLSPKNMKESKINSRKSEQLFWGADLDFYKQFNVQDEGFFLSTGKENRDFNALISVFNKIEYPLVIRTSPHAGMDYAYLKNIKHNDNVTISIVPKDDQTTIKLAEECSRCSSVVISLLPEAIGYCVGWSSCVEAMALGKPIVSTYNPYYPINIEEYQCGKYFNDSVVPNAIKLVNTRGRELAMNMFNMQIAGKQLVTTINQLLQ